jgi:tRNA threonylcarbamoyladenosine biosynthesis protein TsaE
MAQSPCEVNVPDEAAMIALGARLARVLAAATGPLVIFLSGELGAGKTTLVRGALRALGASGTIRSPTFTLLEPYTIGARTFAHLDLYRLESPGAGDIEALGIRDLLGGENVLLVEWPERAPADLPLPDMQVLLEFAGHARRLSASGRSARGSAVVQEWLR